MSKALSISDDSKMIFDVMDNGIIITDKDTVVKYVNPSFLEFAGLKEEQIIGKVMRDVRSHSELHTALEKREPIYNLRREQDGVKSYTSLIPIIVENELVGGLCVVKEADVLKTLINDMYEIRRKERYLGEITSSNFTRFQFDMIVGKNGGLKEIVKKAKKIAENDGSILITGESGVGKEVFAQSIHNHSNRSEKPFIAVNCAAIPEALWESEFFGYTTGAFTGAKKEGKMGLFEMAQGGTLFLDEVGEIPISLQTKLLRVLEEDFIRKVGSEKETSVDVRIIAATNKDISKLVANGEFRLDLYYRIAVFPLDITPLRSRKQDISEFVYGMLEKHNNATSKNLRISKSAIEALKNYDWPGNVRELSHTMEFVSSFKDANDIITPADLPNHIVSNFHQIKSNLSLKEMISIHEKEIVKKHISQMGNSLEAKKEVAKKLDISLAKLYRIIRDSHN